MKSCLILLFLTFYSCSCYFTSVKLADYYGTDCEFPVRFYSFDEVYQGHPYQDANTDRNFTLENVFEKDLGDKKFYKIEKALGSGTFGSVFKAIHTPTNDSVALKVLLHSNETQISREVHMLRELKDAPNFLAIRDVLKEEEDGETFIGLISDFFAAESFRDIYPTLDAYQVKVFLYQTIQTLDYAHSRGILHRDVKQLNVLMNTKTLEAKVIDWGQADFYVPGKNLSTGISTLYYKGPELLLKYPKYDYSVDVWSTGCMFAEMAFKKYHFFNADRVKFPRDPNLNENQIKRRANYGILDAYARVLGTKKLLAYVEKYQDDMQLDILEWVGDYEEVPFTGFITDQNADMIDPLVIDLLSKMLVFDHTKRITMKDALAHPYFDEVRDEY